jgi:DNA-binding GntR family transcriptional regulator
VKRILKRLEDECYGKRRAIDVSDETRQRQQHGDSPGPNRRGLQVPGGGQQSKIRSCRTVHGRVSDFAVLSSDCQREEIPVRRLAVNFRVCYLLENHNASCPIRQEGRKHQDRPLGPDRPVHEKLKEMILDQKLGPGAYLNIDKLCKQLNVSSSPLREALARLAVQRLVRFEPFIGYSVAEVPDRKYYSDLMNVRLLLECYAARVGAPQCRSSCLAAMDRAVRSMERLHIGAQYKEYRGFNSWDAKFHQALVESANNLPLVQVYLDLHVHLHVARLYVVTGGFDQASAVRDHTRILDAFKKRDAAAAEASVRHHLENVQVLRNLSESEPALSQVEART